MKKPALSRLCLLTSSMRRTPWPGNIVDDTRAARSQVAGLRVKRNVVFRGVLWISLLAGLLANSAAGQSTRFRQRQLHQKLSHPVTVAWQDQRLGLATSRLAALYHVPIWRDRRVDPNQSVSLTQTRQPLGDVFAMLAEQRSLSVAVLPGVLYLGPTNAGERLETLLAVRRANLTEASSTTRRKWLTPVKFEWPRLSEPAAILRDVAAHVGVQLQGAEQVPHDLWDAGSVTVAPVDVATLVLFGFDLTLRIDPQGSEVTVVDIERPIEIVRTYRLEDEDRTKLGAFQQAAPGARLKVDQGQVELAGTLAQHRKFAGLIGATSMSAAIKTQAKPAASAPAREQTATAARSQQVYTLDLENQPVGPTIMQLAAQLDLAVVWRLGEEAEAIRGRRVSCRVREATLDELLHALLTPAGLAAERDGRRLVIEPR